MTRDKAQDRDRSAASSAASALPQGSLGAWLRTQREARGVSLREIADASKISVRYLEALEHDRFDILPAPVFTRGFLREYSRVVGLDADEVVNLYLLAADERPELPSEEAGPRSRGPAGPSPLGYGLLLVVGVVLLVGVAALLGWWAQRRTGPAPRPAAAGPAAAASGVAEPPAQTPAAAGATLPEPASAAVAAPVPVAPAPGPPPVAEGAPAGAAAPPAGAPMRVVLEFSEDCWVEYVVDGGRRTGELRTSGEVVQLEAAGVVLLTLGNVPAVRVEVDGRPYPLPAAGTRVVRDLRIAREAPVRPSGADAAP